MHKSLWNIEALLLLTISVFGLFMFGYVYIGIGLLKYEWNNAFFYTTYAGLFVLIWVLFLQRNYLYEDEIVVFFPIRSKLIFPPVSPSDTSSTFSAYPEVACGGSSAP